MAPALRPLLWALPLLALYLLATARLDRLPRAQDPRELDAVLPLSAQMAMAAGDRYLAGNLATIRALMANPERMTPDQMALLARVHEDAAFLHPANEDNYYVAANILPWNGHFDAGQRILRRAYEARRFDWLPGFYYGFDLWFFRRDAIAGAKWLNLAATRASDENDRLLLETMAVRWMEQGYETNSALRLLRGIAAQARHGKLRQYYETRIRRLEDLQRLEQAAAEYRRRSGQPLRELGELVTAGLIAALPVDPFGFGFVVDRDGQPLLLNSPRQGAAQK